MKSRFYKHTLSLMLALLLLLTCFPGTVQAGTFASRYDAEAAVTYAKNHWDDGVGVCDQFVKACLAAGGVEILAGDVDPLKDALVDAGLGSLVSLKLSEDGVHAIQADNPTVQAGDILFFYCEECAESVHTVIIGGYSDEGYLYTYGHNPGWDRVDWLGNFTHTTDDGEAHRSCYQYYAVTMDRANYSHPHNFTDGHYEEAHPHKMYAKCSCGAKYYLGWNATVSYCTTCNPPVSDVPVVTATANMEEGNIALQWTTVENALEYQVWRAKSQNGTYFNIYSAMGTRMVNKSVTVGTVYYYKVIAVLEKDAYGNVVREAVSQVVSCQLAEPEDPAVAVIGETKFETLDEALSVAVSGDTVRLLKDTDSTESLVLVSPGVTLDLDGYTLTAKYLIGLEGSMVTGKAVDKNGQNGAKLVIAQNGLVLSSTAPAGTSTGYKLIPVWNGDHYIFSQAAILQTAFNAGDDNVRLDFIPNFTGFVKNNLFKTDGCEDNDVSVIIAVSWVESGIQVTQEYFYTTPLVIDAMNNKLLFAEMTGCNAKEDLVFRIAIKTDSGVEVVSQDYHY